MFVNSSAIRGSLSSCGVERWKQFQVVSFCCCPDGPRQAKELCDVIGRGDTDFEQVGAGYATLLIPHPCRKGRPVSHAGDGRGLDQYLTVGIPPDLARKAVDGFHRHRCQGQAMHVGPLLDDLVGIQRAYGLVRASVPHGYFGPGTSWAGMIGGTTRLKA